MLEGVEGDERTNCNRSGAVGDLRAMKPKHRTIGIGLDFAQAARLVERNNPTVHLRNDLCNRELEDARRSRILECGDQRVDFALGDDGLNGERLPAGKR